MTDPVGATDIAFRLGVQPQTVAQWRHRELLPEPTWMVGGRPAWDWSVIKAWAEKTSRMPCLTGAARSAPRSRRPR